jgi:hypothetical protein
MLAFELLLRYVDTIIDMRYADYMPVDRDI